MNEVPGRSEVWTNEKNLLVNEFSTSTLVIHKEEHLPSLGWSFAPDNSASEGP